MCGIAGFVSPQPRPLEVVLRSMATCLAHRGPDGDGFWQSADERVGLAHRRLSIVDLSVASDQPLTHNGDWLVFNGMIYNYRQLRAKLEQQGHRFRSQGDGEVIIALWQQHGVGALEMLEGMFAFALYQASTGELWLARDRFGEKPLYYHAQYGERGRFTQCCFASEMKALWAAGAPRKVNGTALLHYLGLGQVQDPLNKTHTFFNDVLSLPPGHYLRILPEEGRVQMRRWFRAETYRNQLVFGGDEAAAVNQFRTLLTDSVVLRLQADVPLGASVSGGVDSSAIAALVSRMQPPLRGFSAQFPGFAGDESAYVKLLESSLGSRLQVAVTTPTAEELAHDFDRLLYHQEEPLQSASVYTQFRVYQLARQQGVPVLLDGQGADEVLGGYRRYMRYYLMELWRREPGQVWKERGLLKENGLLESFGLKELLAGRLPKRAATALHNRSYKQLLRTPQIHPDFLYNHRNYDRLQKPVVEQLNDLLHYSSFQTGLQELLRYADKNSMAHGCEVRLPFLAPPLVQWLFSLHRYKVHRGWNKWLLRQAISEWLPEGIAWRKGKVGYEPPQQQWMRHPLMQEKVMAARQKLVDAAVLLPAVLKTPIDDGGAHSGDNYSWRQLCAAAVL